MTATPRAVTGTDLPDLTRLTARYAAGEIDGPELLRQLQAANAATDADSTGGHASPGTPSAGLDLSGLAAEVTARIDGYRHWAGDATWEVSPGDRDDEIVMVRLTQDGAAETRTIRVHLEER